MRNLGLALLLVIAASICGCAPYIGTCSWIVPDAGNALKVIEARKPTAGECNCLNCGAPGRFQIVRAGYTLEFWNGDRWYPELYVRGRGNDGSVLTLATDSAELLRIAPHVPAADSHGFEYFVRMESEDATAATHTMNIRVVDSNGQLLGVESIQLSVVTRKDVAIEYI